MLIIVEVMGKTTGETAWELGVTRVSLVVARNNNNNHVVLMVVPYDLLYTLGWLVITQGNSTGTIGPQHLKGEGGQY